MANRGDRDLCSGGGALLGPVPFGLEICFVQAAFVLTSWLVRCSQDRGPLQGEIISKQVSDET